MICMRKASRIWLLMTLFLLSGKITLLLFSVTYKKIIFYFLLSFAASAVSRNIHIAGYNILVGVPPELTG